MNLNKYENLSVDFCKIKMPNPFILASAPPTSTGEMIRRAFQAGWGGAVIKTMRPDTMIIEDATPRFATLRSNKNEVIGFQNCEMLSKRPLSIWLDEIRALKAEFPDRALIASIMADIKKEEWQELALAVENAGVDAIELNYSCPNGVPEQGLGSAIGQVPAVTKQITSWVKEAVKVPVIVKLTPNVTDIANVGIAAKNGGADILSAINTVQCLIGVDIDTFCPNPDIHGKSAYGGYSGIAIRPIGLKAVAQLASTCEMPIMGIGGIEKWKHAAEYILLGAGCVQVCTAVMLNGYKIIDELTKGLSAYLTSKGFQSIQEIVGIALPQIHDHAGLNKKDKVKVNANTEKCIGCGKCVISCLDGGYGALSIGVDKKVAVDKTKCDGCGLCPNICPFGVLKF